MNNYYITIFIFLRWKKEFNKINPLGSDFLELLKLITFKCVIHVYSMYLVGATCICLVMSPASHFSAGCKLLLNN